MQHQIPDALLKQHANWVAVVNERDIDAYANLLTPDALWIPPAGHRPVIGRQDFKAWLTPFMNNFSYDFSITEMKIQVSGNWAFERARFRSKMTALIDDKSMEHAGTFSVFWKLESDGKWYIDRYVDDTDLPRVQ